MKQGREDLKFQLGSRGRTVSSSSDSEPPVRATLSEFGIRSDFGCGTVHGLSAEVEDTQSDRPREFGMAHPNQPLIPDQAPGLLHAGEDLTRIFGYL